MAQQSMVITLVHGTFASNTGWVHPDSSLYSGLRKHFPGARIVNFSWSGANNQQQRLEASQTLNRKLRDQLAASPNACHFMVAHSHGGNIALYAFRHGGLDGHVQEVFCLNTPFLCATPRSIGATIIFVYWLVMLFLAVFSVLGILTLIASLVQFTYDVRLPMAALLTSVTSLAVCFLYQRREAIYRWLVKRQNALIADMELPGIKRTRVTSFWSASDEVYSGFSVLEGLSTLPYLVLHPLVVIATFSVSLVVLQASLLTGGMSVYEMPQSLPWLIASALQDGRNWASMSDMIVGHFTGIYLIGWGISKEENEIPGLIWTAIVQSLFLTLYIALAALVSALLLNLGIRVLPIGVRWYRFVDSLFVRLSFTLVPVRANHIAYHDVVSEKGLLQHTNIYEQKVVLDGMVEAIGAAIAQKGR